MSSNKYYYYLKNELNSIKFILIVIILLYYLFICFSFFLPKNIFHHNWRAWFKVVFWVTDSNQEWAVVLLNKLSL